MYILLLLFFVFFVGSNAKKQGDFGIFSACTTKNLSLRLDCYYAQCQHSPSFICTFKESGNVLYKASNDTCKLILTDQNLLPVNMTMNYTCTLTRKNRNEDKQLTIVPSKRRGKRTTYISGSGKIERIKACPDTTGLHLHQAPSSLWPVVTLSLWRVLVTDSHAT